MKKMNYLIFPAVAKVVCRVAFSGASNTDEKTMVNFDHFRCEFGVD
jgi:hypothetical protein